MSDANTSCRAAKPRTVLEQLGELNANAHSLAILLQALTPEGLARLLSDPTEEAAAKVLATAFARNVHPLLAELERLKLYVRTRGQ